MSKWYRVGAYRGMVERVVPGGELDFIYKIDPTFLPARLLYSLPCFSDLPPLDSLPPAGTYHRRATWLPDGWRPLGFAPRSLDPALLPRWLATAEATVEYALPGERMGAPGAPGDTIINTNLWLRQAGLYGPPLPERPRHPICGAEAVEYLRDVAYFLQRRGVPSAPAAAVPAATLPDVRRTRRTEEERKRQGAIAVRMIVDGVKVADVARRLGEKRTTLLALPGVRGAVDAVAADNEVRKKRHKSTR